jgi:1,4-dihydroxy-2-naphthoate polyprenyltransferase
MTRFNIQDWVLASRLRTLPAAIAPVLLGWSICENKHALAALAALFGAILIQIATNFANDYFDFVNGADTEDRIGPTRATQAGLIKPHQMKWAFILTFALTLPIIGYLTIRGGMPVVWIGITSIASGILYTGGPKPLGYMGLGDVFVFIFFGPIAVAGTDYVQSLTWSTNGILLGAACGLLSTAILVVNNLRDRETDAVVGKNTLAVRFGQTFARIEYTLCFILTLGIIVYFGLQRSWTFIALLALVPSIPLQRSMWTESGRALDPNLGKTAKILVLFSILFSIGWNIPV